ncbi:MAG: MutS-related protein [Alistipes onderdonkii]
MRSTACSASSGRPMPQPPSHASRSETQTCRPQFVDGKCLKAERARNIRSSTAACPIRSSSTAQELPLTGSNMSGKTTFIRTLVLNALTAETLDICFRRLYTAPYMRLLSSIRISDDIAEGTSYYLQEVLTVKRFLEASQDSVPCLFALDELFKGTNTTERIAAGKAVLAHLNRRPAHRAGIDARHRALAELLDSDGYELHHFREEVVDGRLRSSTTSCTRGAADDPQRNPHPGTVRLSAQN